MDLKNKAVLITGASKGIGRSAAIAFAKEGSSVVINYKSDSRSAQEVLEECNKFSEGNFVLGADVAKKNEVEKMIEEIKKKFSRIDVLVNNAGIFDDRDSPTSIEAFENVYRSNFLSLVMVTKYALDLMKDGKIINLSSVHGRLGHGNPGAIAYSSFKAALESYTKNLAKKLAPKILVNAIAPGRVATPMWGRLDLNKQKRLGQVHLIKRMITSEEIAEGIIFVAKNDAMCGEVLTIDGGMSLVTLG